MGHHVRCILVAALCLMNFLKAWGMEIAAGLCCEIILGSQAVTSAYFPQVCEAQRSLSTGRTSLELY